jgi:hypothetical protein
MSYVEVPYYVIQVLPQRRVSHLLISLAVNTKIVLGHNAQAVSSSCVLSDDTKLTRNQTLRHHFRFQVRQRWQDEEYI